MSNNRTVIERATSLTLFGRHIELPRTAAASRWEVEHLVYLLAVGFGIVEVPTATVHGIWRGKDGHDWRLQCVEVDCRSTVLTPQCEDDRSLDDSDEDLEIT